MATGGSHVTTGDFFKAAEVKIWKAEIKELEKVKLQRLVNLACAKKGKEVLEQITINNIDILSNKMKKEWVDALLNWYGVKSSEGCRLIGDRRRKWAEVCSTDPPLYLPWAEEDEAKLKELKEFNIEMGDTALGREKERRK